MKYYAYFMKIVATKVSTPCVTFALKYDQIWSFMVPAFAIIFLSMKNMLILHGSDLEFVFHACNCFSEKLARESVACSMISPDHTSHTSSYAQRNARIKVSQTLTTPRSHQTGVKHR